MNRQIMMKRIVRTLAPGALALLLAAGQGCGKSAGPLTPPAPREQPATTPALPPGDGETAAAPITTATPALPAETEASAAPAATPTMDLANMQDTDLVSLDAAVPGAVIDIVFAREDNPFNYRFFRVNKAYMRYGTAKKLAAAERDFERRGLRLKIWSTYRPFPVQVKMFAIVGGNANWVSDPYHETGKRTHVRGVAIDCTLVDAQGRELAMPTTYLDFRRNAERMKRTFKGLPPEEQKNSDLLLKVMTAHGLEPYVNEWWHFQDTAWAQYPAITMDEFPQIHRELLVPEIYALK